MKMKDTAFPHIPDAIAIFYVALTIIIMSYSALLNVIPILIFFAIWLPHFYYKRIFILRPTWDLFASLALPFLACYSFFWSDFPGHSIYTGLEFVAMVVCTILIARLVSIPALLKGISIGVCITMIITLMNGSYGKDLFSDGYALVGLFGSKNEVGFISEIGIFTSLILMTAKRTVIEKIAFGLIPFVICAACFYMSKSSSSYASLAVIIVVTIAGWILTRLPKNLRPIALGLGALSILTLGAIVLATGANPQDKVLQGLGKDSTLTGRTYLWSEGIKVGKERPLLGHGYTAFWVAGQPQAEKYWHEFFIPNPTGFHFHNLYIQSFVDLGLIGLFIVCVLALINCFISLTYIVRQGMQPEYIFTFGLAVMFLIRAMVEVDWLGPFGIGPLLFFIILPILRNAQPSAAALTPN